MGQGLSDAVFELNGACVHSLRFAFGAPLGYPDAPTQPEQGDNPPPALFHRIVAATPPPTRRGEPWYTGMRLAGEPFLPETGAAKLAEVTCDEGIPSLDAPEPGTVVLDENFRVGKRSKIVDFPGQDHGRFMISIRYWSPIPDGHSTAQATVAYYDDSYRMAWTDPVTVGDWVAVSFAGFRPPERDSADVLVQIGECDESCSA